MFGGFHMGGGWFWFGFILLMVIFGFLLLQMYTKNKDNSETSYPKSKRRTKTARDIADERYANGDISRDEYSRIIEDIKNT